MVPTRVLSTSAAVTAGSGGGRGAWQPRRRHQRHIDTACYTCGSVAGPQEAARLHFTAPLDDMAAAGPWLLTDGTQ